MIFVRPGLAQAVMAILVAKLGGKITLTQHDFGDIAYKRLEEEGFEDGRIELTVVGKTAQ